MLYYGLWEILPGLNFLQIKITLDKDLKECKYIITMKKVAAIVSSIAYLSSLTNVFAVDSTIAITQRAPGEGGGYTTIGFFISNLITIGLTIGIIAVLIMLVWGAFDWIMSGGDKDAVGKARSRIINALIGLAVMAVAFALAKVGASIAGINLTDLKIPGPQ